MAAVKVMTSRVPELGNDQSLEQIICICEEGQQQEQKSDDLNNLEGEIDVHKVTMKDVSSRLPYVKAKGAWSQIKITNWQAAIGESVGCRAAKYDVKPLTDEEVFAQAKLQGIDPLQSSWE